MSSLGSYAERCDVDQHRDGYFIAKTIGLKVWNADSKLWEILSGTGKDEDSALEHLQQSFKDLPEGSYINSPLRQGIFLKTQSGWEIARTPNHPVFRP